MRGIRLVLAATVLVISSSLLVAEEPKAAIFGSLQATSADAAKTKCAEWLKQVGKEDAKAFDAIWATDKSVLDKVADTLALGDADAAKLLAEAREPNAPPPTDVPALLQDAKKPLFFRANLGLAYAKALANRRVYEEALDTLSLFKPEHVVDPSAFLFNKAVAEHAQLKKIEAVKSITRLLEDCNDAPERYLQVAYLMANDIKTWKEEKDKDLEWVGRMMNNIERRLDLSRGGPTTQDQQKRVLLTLDELIKKLEDEQQQQQQGQGQGQGKGQSKGNKPGNNNNPTKPQEDSFGGTNSGPGQVEAKKFKETTENWAEMPPKDRANALLDRAREMPAKHRELVEQYIKKLAQGENK